MGENGILGPTTGRRLGTSPFLTGNGGGLAIDVAVTNPLAKSYHGRPEPCEDYARTQKHGKYDKGFVGPVMVWEATGALNSEVLHSLFRFAAKQLGREFTSYCGPRLGPYLLLSATLCFSRCPRHASTVGSVQSGTLWSR